MAASPSSGSRVATLNYLAATARPRRSWRAAKAGLNTFMVLGLLGLMVAPFSFNSHAVREGASPRMRCAVNLKQIGLAIMMYANDHHDQFPDSLQEVLAEEDIGPEVFVCPAGTDTAAVAPTRRATAAALGQPGHCSYIYLGKGLTETQAQNDPYIVLAYEPLSTHHGPMGSGMNALFGDGHVEFLPAPGVLPWIGKSADGLVQAEYVNGFVPNPTTQPLARRK